MTPEGTVKEAVKKELARHKIYQFVDVASGKHPDAIGFYWMPVQGPYSVKGVHDFVGAIHGVFFSLETKAPDNPEDETVHQGRFRVAVTQTGGIALTGVRSPQPAIREVMEFVEQHRAKVNPS
jgi:hypothetical protein